MLLPLALVLLAGVPLDRPDVFPAEMVGGRLPPEERTLESVQQRLLVDRSTQSSLRPDAELLKLAPLAGGGMVQVVSRPNALLQDLTFRGLTDAPAAAELPASLQYAADLFRRLPAASPAEREAVMALAVEIERLAATAENDAALWREWAKEGSLTHTRFFGERVLQILVMHPVTTEDGGVLRVSVRGMPLTLAD